MWKKLVISVLTCVVGFSICYLVIDYWKFSSKTGTAVAAQNPLIGQKVTLTESFDLNSSKNISLNFSDDTVLLVFFSTTCDACQHEMGELQKLYAEIAPQIKVYGVSVDSVEATRNFVSQYQIPFQVLVDQNRSFSKFFKLKVLPTKYLIKDGVIKSEILGTADNPEEIKRRILS